MIEPTDEMVHLAVDKFLKHPELNNIGEIDTAMRETLAAVLAIVDRDRLANPAAIRRALDEAVNAAEPIAGGPLLLSIRLLKRTLDHFPAKATR